MLAGFSGFLADYIARNFWLNSFGNWLIWSMTINKPDITGEQNASYIATYFWLYSHLHLAI